jgi:hypothetical protein
MKKITPTTIDTLLKQARFRENFKFLSKGKTFKDLSTVIVIPIPGDKEEKKSVNCPKCKHKIEYTQSIVSGLSPIFVEAFKRLVKPMNVPIIEMMVSGYEVGDAYSQAVDTILSNPGLKNFKYMLTVEYDNIVPFIPNTGGPLMMLYDDIEKGFDIVGGLYWTKGIPSMPLIYGDVKSKKDDSEGYFKVIHNWKDGDLVECNGMGMGFTLFKMEIFKDKRLEKPYFKTCNEHAEKGTKLYTQDLYFFEQARKLGYRCAVDTKIKVGHLDFKSGVIY